MHLPFCSTRPAMQQQHCVLDCKQLLHRLLIGALLLRSGACGTRFFALARGTWHRRAAEQ
jgi:hypothetical protein